MQATTSEPMVDVETIGTLLNKGRRWIYANQDRLGIPRYRLGNHYRYRVSEVAAWVETLG